MAKNAIFGADVSSSMDIDNKNKDILILVEGTTQRLDDATAAEAIYLINFTQRNKRYVISLNYNGSNSFLLMLQKSINSKHKTLKQKIIHCVYVIFEKMFQFAVKKKKKKKKKGLKLILNFFYVDFDPIDTNNVLDTQKYLMKSA